MVGGGGITVKFAVSHPTAAAAQASSAALTGAMSSNAFTSALNVQLVGAGGAATTVSVVSAPVVILPPTFFTPSTLPASSSSSAAGLATAAASQIVAASCFVWVVLAALV
jgi:hypothetical protein